MITKLIMCPKCKNEITVQGNAKEKIFITCSKCNTKGVFTFPGEDTAIKKIDKQLAIEVNGLVKTFNGFKAVDNVSFSVRKGEIFGFLGPNGAGKTTTIKSVLDLIHANSGDIKINGLNIKTDGKNAKKYVGYLPERVAFYDNLTALQNLYFYAEMKKTSKSGCKQLIEDMGLGDVVNKKVGKFSKGMVQRLGMAQAMIGFPPILILDEPSSGLDPRGAVLIRNTIKELQKKGTSIFLSSHILAEVQEICDRVGIINKGHLVAQDSVSSLGLKLNLKPKLTLELEQMDDEIKKAIDDVSGIDDIKIINKIINIICDPKVKAKVIVAIEKAGGNIINLHTTDPSLEQVFMRYTE
jgi:ABC-type multidrug transport system ATPase subunit